MLTHTTTKKFKCAKCLKMYKMKGEKNRHEKWCGVPKDKTCMYADCDFKYAKPLKYNEHLCTKHSL